jgi:hypothetical protein
MISNLERLIPTLTKVQDNIDKEIEVVQAVTSHTQAYAKEERVRISHLYYFRNTLIYLKLWGTKPPSSKRWERSFRATRWSLSRPC